MAGCCHTINDIGQIVGFTVEPTNPTSGPPFFGKAHSPTISTLSSLTQRGATRHWANALSRKGDQEKASFYCLPS